MKIRREWGMPSSNTFECPPIRSFIDYYLRNSKISVDPFARNFNGCTYTNDLNPNTSAQYHMTAIDFLRMIRDKEIRADLVVFDPPYSARQAKECYESFGRKFTSADNNAMGYKEELLLINDIMVIDGIVLSFGWTSTRMGINLGYCIEEILLVSHGRIRQDTICMAERRVSEQINLFPNND